MGRGKLYVYMPALCVCRTLHSRLMGACKYMELEQQPRFLRVALYTIYLLLSSFSVSSSYLAVHFPLSITLGRA